MIATAVAGNAVPTAAPIATLMPWIVAAAMTSPMTTGRHA
jgi:hypothetical protein